MQKALVILFLFCITQVRSQSDSVAADSLIAYGKKYLGVKYKYGSIDPSRGFDCSGFVYHVFLHYNLKVPRASMDYEQAGKIIPLDSCQPGDVIVFTGTNAKIRKPGHVGIILSKPGEEIQFIHSSSGKKRNGVIVSNFKESPYYRERFIKVVNKEIIIYYK